MILKTRDFKFAYNSYYQKNNGYIGKDISILEIGGGAHPSIQNRENLIYTMVDPDRSELMKSPSDVIKIEGMVQDIVSNQKYDLIISKMVLEHVEDPDTFHKSVLDLLNSDGRVIHFFAGRHSLPAFVNRMLPESFGDAILKVLKNRNLDDSPKYEAYYRRTLGHTKTQIKYFQSLGYEIESYSSFVGHKYLQAIPILGYLEKLYTSLLSRMNVKQLATVGLVVLKKNKKNA